MMQCLSVLLVSLLVSYFKDTHAINDVLDAAGLVVDSADKFGVTLPGYAKLLSHKSSILTIMVHYFFGNKWENVFKGIINKAAGLMPDQGKIDDVLGDNNEEEMTFKDGVLSGLSTLEVTPDTTVNILWSRAGLPVASVSLHFTNLRIDAFIKKKFTIIGVNGPVSISVLNNNFVAKFHLWPGILERCYLKLYRVLVTDLEELQWDVKNESGSSNTLGKYAIARYFLAEEGPVEEHIKLAIVNAIYLSLPKASSAICNNKTKLKKSTYSTARKKHQETSTEGKNNAQGGQAKNGAKTDVARK